MELSEISASPEAIREFFYRCNTDNVFRARFLDQPVETLNDNGISINERAAGEIISYVKQLKDSFEKEIYLTPVGWEDHRWELMENGWGIVVHGSRRAIIP
jgi:hypothetical protein